MTSIGGDYVFRACFVDSFQGNLLAKFSKEQLKAKSAAVMYDESNDYAIAIAEDYVEKFKLLGGTISNELGFNTGDVDYSTQLNEIKKRNPDVLLLSGTDIEAGLIAKQARKIGIKSVFLGGDALYSNSLFEIAGESINDTYICYFYSIMDKNVADFVESYKNKYQEYPYFPSFMTYDAGMILFDAIARSKSINGTEIKDALIKTDMEVVTGHIKFDNNRNPIKGGVIMKAVNNRFEFVNRIEP